MVVIEQKAKGKLKGMFGSYVSSELSDQMVESGEVENTPAPHLAINYYNLGSNAKLSDVIKCVRADEQHHSETNHNYANKL